MVRSWTQRGGRAMVSTNRAQRLSQAIRPVVEPLEHRLVMSSMVLTVNSAADDIAGPTTGAVTLRDAIAAINADTADSAASPDQIHFAISGTSTVSLAGNLPQINRPVTIDGSGQGSVTVQGNGFATLIDNSAVTLTAVMLTGGPVTLADNSTLTVGAASTLTVSGDLVAGNSVSLNNYSNVWISGNFIGGTSTGVFNAQFSTGFQRFGASFNVAGSFTAGDNSFIFNNGSALLSVGHDLTLGTFGYIYNGASSTDAASLSVGGNLTIGDPTSGPNDSGYIYNEGASTLTVTGNFTMLGGGGNFLYNGQGIGDTASLNIGGTLNLGSASYLYNYGTTTFATAVTVATNFNDYGSVAGASNITVPTGGVFAIEAGATVSVKTLAVQSGGVADIFGTLYAPSPASLSGNIITEAGGSIVYQQIQTTPVVTATAQSAAFTGLAQGYPLADITVTGANGLTSAGGTFTFSYNGSATAPTTIGVYNVLITFIPTNTAAYTSASTTTTWTISKALPTLSVIDAGGVYNGSPFAATATLNGASSLEGVGLTLDYVNTVTGRDLGAVAPRDAGSYKVTASFAGSADYLPATNSVAFVISKATPVITWNPSPLAYLTPLGCRQLDARANVWGRFTYTPAAGTRFSPGVQTLSATFVPWSSNYLSVTQTTPLTVLGPGLTVIGSKLYIVGGATSKNESITALPTGLSSTGSTGIAIQSLLDGVSSQTTYPQSFTAIHVTLGGANENIQFASTLAIRTSVTAGDGNDTIQLGNGNNRVTLGNGNDSVTAGSGHNTIHAGNGNDTVHLGNGNDNRVILGDGNDTVQTGNGDEQFVLVGKGNDSITLGNTSQSVVILGNGHDTVQFGNGDYNTVFAWQCAIAHDHIQFGAGTHDVVIGTWWMDWDGWCGWS